MVDAYEKGKRQGYEIAREEMPTAGSAADAEQIARLENEKEQLIAAGRAAVQQIREQSNDQAIAKVLLSPNIYALLVSS